MQPTNLETKPWQSTAQRLQAMDLERLLRDGLTNAERDQLTEAITPQAMLTVTCCKLIFTEEVPDADLAVIEQSIRFFGELELNHHRRQNGEVTVDPEDGVLDPNEVGPFQLMMRQAMRVDLERIASSPDDADSTVMTEVVTPVLVGLLLMQRHFFSGHPGVSLLDATIRSLGNIQRNVLTRSFEASLSA